MGPMLLAKLVLLFLLAPRTAAGVLDFDSTLGYPGEGPTAACIRVDEASGGSMPFGSGPALMPFVDRFAGPTAGEDGAGELGRRERKPRV